MNHNNKNRNMTPQPPKMNNQNKVAYPTDTVNYNNAGKSNQDNLIFSKNHSQTPDISSRSNIYIKLRCNNFFALE